MAEDKRKVGRPPKTNAEKCSLTVRFRVTPEQMNFLHERAKQCNLTLSEYARQTALTGKVTARTNPAELRLVAELTRERTNLNQIARIANATGDLHSLSVRLAELLAFYDNTIRRIKG